MADQNEKWNLNAVKELMRELASTGLSSLTIKDGDFAVMLESKKEQPAAPVPAAVQPAGNIPAAAAAPPPPPEAAEGSVVKSPLVGTFYASAAPDKPAFVQVGGRVKKGDVLFVIESMKLMNEIQSDFDGEVAEILVENAQGVEYNQPIMVIR